MITLEVLVVEVGVVTGSHQLQVQLSEQLGRCDLEEASGLSRQGTPQIRFTVIVAVTRWRQLQQAIVLHAEHGDAAAHVLEAPVVASPMELLTHEAGQLRTGRRRVLRDQLPDRRKLGDGELSPAIAH